MGDAVFVDEPAYGFGTLERSLLHDGFSISIAHDGTCERVAFAHGSSLFSHVKGNGVCPTGGGGIEVEVHGNKEVAGSHGRTSCTLYRFGNRRSGFACRRNSLAACFGHEIGLFAGRGEFLLQGFVFSFTAYGQVATLGRIGCGLVAIAGNASLVGNAASQLAG